MMRSWTKRSSCGRSSTTLRARPPLDIAYGEDVEDHLPEIAGGLSVALARAFKIIDPNLKNPSSEHWQKCFRLFDLLLTPKGQRPPIMIAWNGSREAVRASQKRCPFGKKYGPVRGRRSANTKAEEEGHHGYDAGDHRAPPETSRSRIALEDFANDVAATGRWRSRVDEISIVVRAIVTPTRRRHLQPSCMKRRFCS